MLLKDTEMDTRCRNALSKKKINTVNELLRFFPRKYYDFRKIVSYEEAAVTHKVSAVSGRLTKVKKNTSGSVPCLKITLEDKNGNLLSVCWFGQIYHEKLLNNWIQENLVVCGEVSSHPVYGYCMTNPIEYGKEKAFQKRIVPVYGKIKNISEEKLVSEIRSRIGDCLHDPLSEEILNSCGLMDYRSAMSAIHIPSESGMDTEQMQKALFRFKFQDLLYFAVKQEEFSRRGAVGTPYSIKNIRNTADYIETLPYSLTKDQQTVYETILERLRGGKRIQALLQGDVGYGKTDIAFICMLLMADSGYQSVLMAPTEALAKQHYEKLSAIGVKYGYRTALLTGSIASAEKKKLLSQIASGDYDFVIGTTGIIQSKVAFRELAFIVIDEEQKFGVEQRDALIDKAGRGVNILSMSATPIPRTLALAIYGKNTEIFELKTRPSNRQEIQTAICRNDASIMQHITKQLSEGRQVYVVCPFITAAEDVDKFGNVISVEDSFRKLSEYFKNTSVKIGCVTGKTNAADAQAVMNDFAAGRIQILVSTTFIEVGINVPNAGTIVINSAERFGLSCLHQLRGRVGRGEYKGYCVLRISDMEEDASRKAAERLKIMTETTDGFAIATEDLTNRKAGNLIGTEQTGSNRYMELMMENKNLYEKVCELSKWMVDRNMHKKLVALMEESIPD